MWCFQHVTFLSMKTLQVFKSLLPVTRLAGHVESNPWCLNCGNCGNIWIVFPGIWGGKVLKKNWLYQLYHDWLWAWDYVRVLLSLKQQEPVGPLGFPKRAKDILVPYHCNLTRKSLIWACHWQAEHLQERGQEQLWQSWLHLMYCSFRFLGGFGLNSVVD